MKSKSQRRAKKAKTTKKAYPSTVWKVSPSPSIWNAVPPEMNVKLVYGDTLRLNDAITGTASHLFRGNSVYDPDYTGVGHQPLGTDQWSTLYKRYQVTASKIEVWYASNTDAVVNNIYLFPSNDVTTPSSVECLEMPLMRTGQTTGRTGSYPGYLSLYASNIDMKGYWPMATDKEMGALFTQNPAIIWFWHIYAESPGALALDLRVNIRITYYVKIYDPVQLLSS